MMVICTGPERRVRISVESCPVAEGPPIKRQARTYPHQIFFSR